MRGRGLVLVIAALVFAVAAHAEERIRRFDVSIEVERSGDIVVTEAIDVVAEGDQIRRGIFRDLPRYYEKDGEKYANHYDILSVTRDGANEPHEDSTEDNAFHVRIGDPDQLLVHGMHHYELRYRTSNQVRYFQNYDELYWNATGNYWLFPIDDARVTVALPAGAKVLQHSGYTGPLGGRGGDFSYAEQNGRYVFATTRPLAQREGLTIALGFAKGVIDPPSAADQSDLLWQRYGSLAILLASFAGVGFFLYRSFDRVGRDPQRLPVFPRYEAPDGYSPAAVNRIYYRALSDHRALIATLMNLAVKGRIKIDASDKKETVLTRKAGAAEPAGAASEDLDLENALFALGPTKTLGEKYDSGFTHAYEAFQKDLNSKYGARYFKWNAGYTIFAIVLSAIAVFVAVKVVVTWTIWLTAAVIALAALNLLFLYLMPAPTREGEEVRSAIAGFKLYLETAEKLQLNAVKVGSEAPPPMTTERYERFLPYAVALNVEKPWTEHFERLVPEEAARYQPSWGYWGSGGHRSLANMSSAMVGAMATGVASALPQSSSSSGSGGGGFSGGGGGGGGGGGW